MKDVNDGKILLASKDNGNFEVIDGRTESTDLSKHPFCKALSCYRWIA
jgi:hypothetical protein